MFGQLRALQLGESCNNARRRLAICRKIVARKHRERRDTGRTAKFQRPHDQARRAHWCVRFGEITQKVGYLGAADGGKFPFGYKTSF